MKLRHRRAASNDSGPILPLTASNPPHANRRRRKRMKGYQDGVKCCFVMTMLLCLIAGFALRFTHGTRNNRRVRQFWSKHKKRLQQKLTAIPISCADGTSGFKDDDYCDCPDGSDEPNTAACSHLLVQKASFRCRDGKMIHASRVRDGVIDCPDRSDEKRNLFQ
jgi:Glucosidase II beta subunit-like/Low-density lipoprotein receptor domain class A